MTPIVRRSLVFLVLATAACDSECNFETFLQVDVQTSLVVGDQFVPQSARLSGCQARDISVSDLRWSSEDETVISIRPDSLGFSAIGVGTTTVQARYVGSGRGNGAGFGVVVLVEGSPTG